VTARLSPEARELIQRRAASSAAAASEIERIPSDVSSPLSFAQEKVWLGTQLDKSTVAYNRCSALHLEGALNVHALERALSAIVERHEILRTEIVLEHDAPRLRVMPAALIPLPIVADLSRIPEEAKERRVNELVLTETRRSFDLDRGPWLRAGLIRESETTHTLFMIVHHIASDGWSDAVMFSELHDLYNAFLKGTESPLPPLPIQYRDLAAFQRRRSASPASRRDVAYWQTHLSERNGTQSWPGDHAGVEVESLNGGKVTRIVSSDVVQQIEQIGRNEGATPAMTALAAFMILTSRFTEQSDTVIGLSTSGRTRQESEALIGFFSGVLPIRVEIDPQANFADLLRRVRTIVLEALAHQETPGDHLLLPQPATGRARRAEVAESLFNFRNLPAFPPALSGLEVQPLEVFNGASVALVDLEITEIGDSWKCDLKFRTELFGEATAHRLLGHYETLLQSIIREPEAPISRQSLLTDNERRQLTVDFSGAVRPLPARSRIDEMIREQSQRTPNAVAVESSSKTVDYATLDERSDALAARLQSVGVGDGDRVGVCMDDSVELVAALLAILKSGAAFVPLDPELPPRRLAYIVADTDPSVIVTDHKGSERFGGSDDRILVLDSDYLASLPAAKMIPRSSDDPHAVACVLYTSGSTGLPKGVLSPHRGITNNLIAVQELYPLGETDRMLRHISLGFDAAAWEIFWPLTVGARVLLMPAGTQRDPEHMARMIRDHRVSTFVCAPSLLKVLLDAPAITDCTHLRRALAIGEVLSPALREKFYSRLPGATLHNLYGPTEASITVTEWNCERDSQRKSIPIGRALPNVELFILDEQMQPVPIGVPGEIFIGGVAVSPGYHDRAELTAERFPLHPFRPDSGERVYRTGDIARFDADGVIEYIGRRDHQLKIRGVRVELEEVEAALERLPSVRESVVVSRRDAFGEHQLVAYIATDFSATLAELKHALEAELPPQFIPAIIVPLTKLPHGPSGKIDRFALPEPTSYALQTEAVPPASNVEKRIASVWNALLDTPILSIGESFFNVGGHSLLAVRMIQRINDEFRSHIKLREFYKDPTIYGLAALLSERTGDAAETRHPELIKVRDRTSRATLFYFNGQPAGTGNYAYKIPQYLPSDRGFYIVPIPILHGPTTVHALASRMIELIREVEPQGPFFLGGNCFGSALALEMAQQLEAGGENVLNVILVHPDALARTHAWYRVIRRVAIASGVPEAFHYAEFSGPFNHALRTMREIWRAQRRMKTSERLEQVRDTGRWLRRFIGGRAGFAQTGSSNGKQRPRNGPRPLIDQADLGPRSVDQELKMHRHFLEEAWISYKLKPYSGKVSIIWPREGPSNPPWDPQALWKHFTPNFEWRDVPGTHVSMMYDHFEQTARALSELVEMTE